MSRIKVLQIIQQGEIGGGESHLLTLIDNLDPSRFEIVVVALSDGEMIRKLSAMGIRNYVVHSRYPFNVMIWKKISKIIKDENISIIHTHGARSLSNVVFTGRKLKIPVIHTVHGWSFHDHLPSWKRKLRIQGEKFLTSKSTINIAVSESNREIGEHRFGTYKSVVINNGVDLSVYTNGDGARIRQENNIAASTLVVTFIARFIHDKNPLPLINAFAEVVARHPDMHLLMVGDGNARADAIQLCKQLKLESKITLTGYRKDIKDLLAASDIFCLPSIKEGLPVSLIEAMAMGAAVIATDVEGCKDVVTDMKDGLLLPLSDLTNNIRKALTTLAENPALRSELIKEAHKTVKERFDATDMTRKVENLYAEFVH